MVKPIAFIISMNFIDVILKGTKIISRNVYEKINSRDILIIGLNIKNNFLRSCIYVYKLNKYYS